MTLFQISSSEGTEIAARIEQNYHDIKRAIDEAAAKAGRLASEVQLVAVSKTVGLPEIAQAIEAGMHDFGENRSQLFAQKQQQFPAERWHFIGRIQTNKLKDLVGKAALVHSLASAHALEVTNKLAGAQATVQPVLIEVNTSGEASKDGVAPGELDALLEMASTLTNIEVRGFMTMAPLAASTQDSAPRRSFEALRILRDTLVAKGVQARNISLQELSMGMSDDFSEAIREGATIIRIGRRLWS